MHLVCSYCLKDMGTKPPLDDDDVTHGMCKACDAHFAAMWRGMSYSEYLERFSYPVVLLEREARVVALNEAAGALLGRTPADTTGLLGGEALECVHARLPGGCGKTIHCPTCSIRNAVSWTHRTGEPLDHVPALLQRSRRTLDLLVSTMREGELVRVTIEQRAG